MTLETTQTITDLAKRAESIEEGAGLNLLKTVRSGNWLRGHRKVTHDFYSTTIRKSGFYAFRWMQSPVVDSYWARINNANRDRPS